MAEAKVKTSLEALCEQGLFKPLGMEGTAFRLAAVDPKRVAMPYGYRKKQEPSRRWAIMDISIFRLAPCARLRRIWRGFS